MQSFSIAYDNYTLMLTKIAEYQEQIKALQASQERCALLHLLLSNSSMEKINDALHKIGVSRINLYLTDGGSAQIIKSYGELQKSLTESAYFHKINYHNDRNFSRAAGLGDQECFIQRPESNEADHIMGKIQLGSQNLIIKIDLADNYSESQNITPRQLFSDLAPFCKEKGLIEKGKLTERKLQEIPKNLRVIIEESEASYNNVLHKYRNISTGIAGTILEGKSTQVIDRLRQEYKTLGIAPELCEKILSLYAIEIKKIKNTATASLATLDKVMSAYKIQSPDIEKTEAISVSELSKELINRPYIEHFWREADIVEIADVLYSGKELEDNKKLLVLRASTKEKNILINKEAFFLIMENLLNNSYKYGGKVAGINFHRAYNGMNILELFEYDGPGLQLEQLTSPVKPQDIKLAEEIALFLSSSSEKVNVEDLYWFNKPAISKQVADQPKQEGVHSSGRGIKEITDALEQLDPDGRARLFITKNPEGNFCRFVLVFP